MVARGSALTAVMARIAMRTTAILERIVVLREIMLIVGLLYFAAGRMYY